MKYLPLIWAGLWRKRTRTVFTLLSVMTAFLLFGMLQGVNSAFTQSVRSANINRLYVASKFSMIEPLPLAMLQRIEQVPGVTGATYGVWFGGYYRERKNFLLSYPVDVRRYFDMFPEMQISKETLETLANTRTGAVIGVELAKKYDWKVGDKITIPSGIWTKADGSREWTFDIVGIFNDTGDSSRSNSLFFNYAYFDEARTITPGTVAWFIVRIADPAQSVKIAEAIDATFANSPQETQTQNEKEYAQAYFKQFGDINLIVSAIIGAVFFALLFLTGNAMMQSFRERIPEIAILKTLGLSDLGVVALLTAEALILCLGAAAIGMLLAYFGFGLIKSMVYAAAMPGVVIAMGCAYAVILALVTVLPPAWRAKQLSIVDGLRKN
jgi:putative ABC transport system permease protein